jgi:hypothetical protein
MELIIHTHLANEMHFVIKLRRTKIGFITILMIIKEIF